MSAKKTSIISNPNRLESSFRDPAGYVFNDRGTIKRVITATGKVDYDSLIKSGLYEVLVSKELLIAHKELSESPKESYKTIEPLQIPAVTYPYEWSFSQLKDAALMTLTVQKIAIKHNMTLKDASAYNIQFIGSKPVFIDTLSFENYLENTPWKAYGQFCRHFLAPLVLMAQRDLSLSQLLRVYPDGIPLDLAAKLIPSKSKLRAGLLMHLHLHAKAQQSKAKDYQKPAVKLSKVRLQAIIDSLEKTISKLQVPSIETEWGDYYSNTNYSSSAARAKAKIVGDLIDQLPRPKQAVDFGGNDGHYSKLFAQKGIYTICADIDPVAVNKNYIEQRKQSGTNMLPILVDLTNPAGGTGWANQERPTIDQRLKSDCVMALALIHHLAISNNLHFDMIAEYFSRIAPYLIIEFVPKSDSQVKKLLSTREDIFSTYDETSFVEQFSKYYKKLSEKKIASTKRTVYLFKRNSV